VKLNVVTRALLIGNEAVDKKKIKQKKEGNEKQNCMMWLD